MMIYLIRHRDSGKGYVGLTTQSVNERFRQHRSKARNGNPYNQPIARAIEKYGWEAFEKFVLQVCETKAELNEAEKFWIDFYDTLKNGYNAKSGGDCANPRSESARANLAKSRLGKKHSPETIERMGAWQRGRKLSEETRAKLSVSHKGKPKSDEWKKRQSAENNPAAKLNWETVREIRRLHVEGLKQVEIRKIYPEISCGMMSNIIQRKNWVE